MCSYRVESWVVCLALDTLVFIFGCTCVHNYQYACTYTYVYHFIASFRQTSRLQRSRNSEVKWKLCTKRLLDCSTVRIQVPPLSELYVCFKTVTVLVIIRTIAHLIRRTISLLIFVVTLKLLNSFLFLPCNTRKPLTRFIYN